RPHRTCGRGHAPRGDRGGRDGDRPVPRSGAGGCGVGRIPRLRANDAGVSDSRSSEHAAPDFAKINGWDKAFETFADFDLPTYLGGPTFQKLPAISDPAALRAQSVDVAIIGAPFDDAVTYRPGARFGPRA